MKNGAALGIIAVTLSVAALYKAATLPVAGDAGQMRGQSAFQRVLATGTIRCAYALWPPAMARDPNTGALSGINHEIMEDIGRELDLKIEWTEEVGFGNYIEGLETGRYDALCTTTWPDPARIRFQTFTMPYYFTPVYGYVRADDTRFDGALEKVNDPNIKIVSIDGDISAAEARLDFPKAGLFTLPQMADAQEQFTAVVTHKADVFFSDDGNFNNFNRTNPGQMRKIENTAPLRIYGEFIAVKQGETHLRDMLNVAITQVINSGKVEKVLNAHAAGIYFPPRKLHAGDISPPRPQP